MGLAEDPNACTPAWRPVGGAEDAAWPEGGAEAVVGAEVPKETAPNIPSPIDMLPIILK